MICTKATMREAFYRMYRLLDKVLWGMEQASNSSQDRSIFWRVVATVCLVWYLIVVSVCLLGVIQL